MSPACAVHRPWPPRPGLGRRPGPSPPISTPPFSAHRVALQLDHSPRPILYLIAAALKGSDRRRRPLLSAPHSLVQIARKARCLHLRPCEWVRPPESPVPRWISSRRCRLLSPSVSCTFPCEVLLMDRLTLTSIRRMRQSSLLGTGALPP
jgi:hypothetical protein